MGQCRLQGPICAETNSDGGENPPGTGFEDPGVIGLDSSSSGGTSVGGISGWPRSIAWSEFAERNSRPAGISEDAQIHSEAVLSSDVTIERENGKLRLGSFTVKIEIVSDDTWVIRGKASAALLAHEQGHFDITGLSGRDTMEDLKALRARTAAELQQKVDRVLRKGEESAKKLTENYDTETNHSQNTKAQGEWEKKIQDAIKNGTRLNP